MSAFNDLCRPETFHLRNWIRSELVYRHHLTKMYHQARVADRRAPACLIGREHGVSARTTELS
jgi:hypothetical protein